MIVPAILAMNEHAFKKQLDAISPYTNYMQIDIADGKFVESKTWHKVRKIKKMLPENMEFELHMMVKNPEREIKKWKKIPQLKKIIFHASAVKDVKKTVKKLSKTGKDIVIALNPEIRAKTIVWALPHISGVQFMTVYPGKQGQPFLTPVIQKIALFHEKNPKTPISADGGINEKNIKDLKKAGVTQFCIGSALMHGDIHKNIEKMQKAEGKRVKKMTTKKKTAKK